MSAKDVQKASITEKNYTRSSVTGRSQKKNELEMMPGCRKKGFDHVLF